MNYKIALLPGDGIGPEVVDATVQVLDAVTKQHGISFSYDTHRFGGSAIDADGHPFPDAVKEAVSHADAVFLGAIGGPTVRFRSEARAATRPTVDPQSHLETRRQRERPPP